MHRHLEVGISFDHHLPVLRHLSTSQGGPENATWPSKMPPRSSFSLKAPPSTSPASVAASSGLSPKQLLSPSAKKSLSCRAPAQRPSITQHRSWSTGTAFQWLCCHGFSGLAPFRWPWRHLKARKLAQKERQMNSRSIGASSKMPRQRRHI